MDATGLLKPLWQQLPRKREELAELSGIRATELSSYNNGKPLGVGNARRIIAAFAERGIVVSLLEVGATEAEAQDQPSLTLRDRLEALEARLAEFASADDVEAGFEGLRAAIRPEATTHTRGVGPPQTGGQA